MKQKRMQAEARRAQLLEYALLIAERVGVRNVGLTDVARRAGVTHSTVAQYFGGLAGLHAEVAHAAVRQRRLRAVGMSLIQDDQRVVLLTEGDLALRQAAVRCVTGSTASA